jgi:serine/threonine protein kinase
VFSKYSTVKLTDFGLAVFLGDDFNDEMDIREGGDQAPGTFTWKAPEVEAPDLRDPVTDKADVWAVGMIIWDMMHATVPHNGRDWNNTRDWLRQAVALNFKYGHNKNTYPGDLFVRHTAPTWNYTTRLTETVKRCLKINTAKRPDPMELRK